MRTLRIAAAIAATLVAAPVAWAQQTPTAQQISDALKPPSNALLRPCAGADGPDRR